jgi:NAD(P)-dependent dehydrogenase (short-subunit alcohol dehydrogenase family)
MPRTVLITGVSSGIGRALALHYLNHGAQVFGISRRAPAEFAGLPGFAFRSVDLRRLDEVAPAVAGLLRDVDRLDLAVLNAGVLGTVADLSEADLDAMRAVMDVNLWANKPVLDAAFARGRRVDQVVAISSGAAVSGARGWNAYALSKAALNMMMALYAAERPETHFAALAPGLVDTAMQAGIRALPDDPRFALVERLKKAAGTAAMPDPDALAPRLAEAIHSLGKRESGRFWDLRALH